MASVRLSLYEKRRNTISDGFVHKEKSKSEPKTVRIFYGMNLIRFENRNDTKFTKICLAGVDGKDLFPL